MSNVVVSLIQFKRTLGSNPPSVVNDGEPSYAYGSDQLFIGDYTGNIRIIGGAKYTSLLSANPGVTTPGKALIVDSVGKTDQLIVGKVGLYSNVITTNGAGPLTILANVNINSNWINNLSDPVQTQDAATKGFVETRANISHVGNVTTGTWSGNIVSTNYGGTGLNYIGSANQVLEVDPTGTFLKFGNVTMFTESITAPVNPNPGDRWLNSTTGILFTWYADDDSTQWVEFG
jgi:hypothetical protein